MWKNWKTFYTEIRHEFSITVADIKDNDYNFPKNVVYRKSDLLDYGVCQKLCTGIDTVIHLAGLVDPFSESQEILNENIKITQNIFRAAVKEKCRRIIFASSAQTIENYPTDIQVNKNMLVSPKNLYGVAKCFGEALAAYYAYNKGISAICLRIGAYEFPEDHVKMNSRDLSAFLHPDDFNQLLMGCIETKNIQYEVLMPYRITGIKGLI